MIGEVDQRQLSEQGRKAISPALLFFSSADKPVPCPPAFGEHQAGPEVQRVRRESGGIHQDLIPIEHGELRGR